jgi:hypothetical protein
MLPRIAEKVFDPDPGVRMASIRAMASTGKSAEFLRAALQSPELQQLALPEKRLLALVLAHVEGMRAAPLLHMLLGRKAIFGAVQNDEVRAAAAAGLGYIPDPRAQDTLERVAKSSFSTAPLKLEARKVADALAAGKAAYTEHELRSLLAPPAPARPTTAPPPPKKPVSVPPPGGSMLPPAPVRPTAPPPATPRSTHAPTPKPPVAAPRIPPAPPPTPELSTMPTPLVPDAELDPMRPSPAPFAAATPTPVPGAAKTPSVMDFAAVFAAYAEPAPAAEPPPPPPAPPPSAASPAPVEAPPLPASGDEYAPAVVPVVAPPVPMAIPTVPPPPPRTPAAMAAIRSAVATPLPPTLPTSATFTPTMKRGSMPPRPEPTTDTQQKKRAEIDALLAEFNAVDEPFGPADLAPRGTSTAAEMQELDDPLPFVEDPGSDLELDLERAAPPAPGEAPPVLPPEQAQVLAGYMFEDEHGQEFRLDPNRKTPTPEDLQSLLKSYLEEAS